MKMIIFFMQKQFISRNSKKSNNFELRRHQWRNDDAMHLLVNKIFYSSKRLASVMSMHYKE